LKNRISVELGAHIEKTLSASRNLSHPVEKQDLFRIGSFELTQNESI